jgi:signal peptidase complex subunit 1
MPPIDWGEIHVTVEIGGSPALIQPAQVKPTTYPKHPWSSQSTIQSHHQTWTHSSIKPATSTKERSYVPISLHDIPISYIQKLTISPQDFRGQSLADFLTTFLLVASGIIAVIVGFSAQDIYKTLYVGLSGTVLTFILVAPQWPFYNKKPEPWLPARVQKASAARPVDLGGVQIEVDGKRVG